MSGEESHSLFACSECKTRKVKCDRTKPVCQRCIRDNATCYYPTARKRPVQMPSRPRLHALENRLVDLEDKLRQKEAALEQASASASASASPSVPSPGTTLISTGRFEQLPPQWQIEALTNIYFEKLNVDQPMIHPARYIASLYQPPHMQPPMCLQYIIMAHAARSSPEYKELSEPFYRRARNYLESDELKGDGHHVSLAHCQAWILVGHLEAAQLVFSRASMSSARAVRLSQILGIHTLDSPYAAINSALPPPRDWAEEEERRRTFWVTFMTDRGTSCTTTWPTLIDATRVTTHLPMSDEAFLNGMPEKSLSLAEALCYENSNRSSFACRVLAMHLLNECIESNQPRGTLLGNLTEEMESTMFWNNITALDNSLALAFNTLPAHMQCPENAHDSHALLCNLEMFTATICLFRAGKARALSEGILPPDIEAKALPAAQQIVTAIALASDIHARFRNPFVGFAAFMASYVFLEDYERMNREWTAQKLTALLDVMVSVGSQNPGFAASMAVQMAKALDSKGIDPTALHKVQNLAEEYENNVSLVVKEDTGTGLVLLCPLEPYLGPHPGGHH